MPYNVDRSWLHHPNRNSPEYREGVKAFIKICETQRNENGDVRCACKKCHNTNIIPFRQLQDHMDRWGFCHSYKFWSYHGESSISPVVADKSPGGEMADVIQDLLGSRHGYIRGIGRKPSKVSHSSEKGQSSQSSQSSQIPKKQQEFINMCQDPSFVAKLMELMESHNKGDKGGGEDEDQDQDKNLE